MRIIAAATVLCVVAAAPAAAETCRESFVRLYVKGNGGVASKSIVVQQVGKGKPTRNYHYSSGKGDWMTVMIEPDDGMATLVRDGVMYSSTNKGKSWKKIRRVDGPEYKTPSEEVRKAEIEKTVSNVVCGPEVLDGVKHNTVAAEYETGQPKSKYRIKYWVHPKTGWIGKTETQFAGFNAAQTMAPAPDLTLPDPAGKTAR